MSPRKRPKVWGSPEQWVEAAESDLRLARLASAASGIRPEQSCFHAQQAAEKALKAVLLFRSMEFPFTHDIEELLRLGEEAGLNPPDNVRQAGVLTPYAIETRYPGYWAEISEEEKTEALRIAGEVLKWAKQVIQKAPGGDQ